VIDDEGTCLSAGARSVTCAHNPLHGGPNGNAVHKEQRTRSPIAKQRGMLVHVHEERQRCIATARKTLACGFEAGQC
jgi:hypothetical protein